ncbi:hypothetical protein Adt_18561 [Abeliophyllum distichum]|uniref:Secreted protein n=1 Tax=Abeliophyllum distichum TaxID=126358 RepID=A0ABD1TJR8_9LAMI
MFRLREELTLVGKRLVCRGPSNIRLVLILGFTQLVPCLHEDAGPLCEDDESAKTKFQLRNELFLVGKRLVCRGPSNIRLVLILSFTHWCHASIKRLGLCEGMTRPFQYKKRLDIGLCPASAMPS